MSGYANRLLAWFLVLVGTSCSLPQKESVTSPSVERRLYGTLSSGVPVTQYTLRAKGIAVKAINYGGIITQIEVPDRHGHMGDVVLGYDDLADYEKRNRFFGAIVGRYANRIRHGVAIIDGERHQLSLNRPPHQLHGGEVGFDKVVWRAETEVTRDYAALHLRYLSVDGEEGYPGNLETKVSYYATQNGELMVEYRATTDKSTVVNLTQHSYFNLSAKGQDNVLGHELTMLADHILALDDQGIPTGDRLAVAKTPFDFRSGKALGQDIEADHPQLRIGKGYDHFYVFRGEAGSLRPVAELYDQGSGRVMSVLSTEQGAQLYSANYLNETVVVKGGVPSQKRHGLCLETGQYPNAPSEPAFPGYTLRPGQAYFAKTVFAFSTR